MNDRPGRRPRGRRVDRAVTEEPDALASIPAGSRISAIVEHPRRQGRYRVVVDEQPVALVSASLIGSLALAVGREIDEPLRAALGRENAALAAYDRGISLLAVRARAAVELERRLQRLGFDARAVQQAIERLTEEGYLDDDHLSRQFARARLGSGSSGRRRVEQELARLGVEREVARAAVAETAAEESVDERESALALARRRALTMRDLAPEVARRRLFGYLARRGFESSDASAAVSTALRELSDEES